MLRPFHLGSNARSWRVWRGERNIKGGGGRASECFHAARNVELFPFREGTNDCWRPSGFQSASGKARARAAASARSFLFRFFFGERRGPGNGSRGIRLQMVMVPVLSSKAHIDFIAGGLHGGRPLVAWTLRRMRPVDPADAMGGGGALRAGPPKSLGLREKNGAISHQALG